MEALLKRLEDGAIVVDPYTGTPSWDGSRPDLGIAVEWFLAKTDERRHESPRHDRDPDRPVDRHPLPVD
jgi:hypothetical protein